MLHSFRAGFVAGLLAVPAVAEDRPIQCFGRIYTEEELRTNPYQIVDTILLLVRETKGVPKGEKDSTFCDVPRDQADLILWVLFADQGFAREVNLQGAVLEQTAKCDLADGGAYLCGDKYSTGEILLQSQVDGTLNATTDSFRMPWIAECGGVINIATNNETTVFRLERQNDADCLRIQENAP